MADFYICIYIQIDGFLTFCNLYAAEIKQGTAFYFNERPVVVVLPVASDPRKLRVAVDGVSALDGDVANPVVSDLRKLRGTLDGSRGPVRLPLLATLRLNVVIRVSTWATLQTACPR